MEPDEVNAGASLKRKNPEDKNPSKKTKLADDLVSEDLGSFSGFRTTAVINCILELLGHKDLIHMGGTNKSFHEICNQPVLWEALFKRNLYGSPSLSLSALQLKSPSHYYSLAYCLQEEVLPKLMREGQMPIDARIEDQTFPNMWGRIPIAIKIIRREAHISPDTMRVCKNMIIQAFEEDSIQGKYILGLINETDDLNEEAFEFYQKAAAKGHKKARKRVIEALYYGSLGQIERSEGERLKELTTYADRGDRYAQKWLSKALLEGYTRKKYEQKLMDNEMKRKAAQGDLNAQKWLTKARLDGILPLSFRSDAERLSMLEERASQGDRYAQKRLNKALHLGKLGLEIFSPLERCDMLKERASQGDLDAEKRLLSAMIFGELGFDQVSDEVRFEWLKSRAATGDKNAQRGLVLVLWYGCELGQKERPIEARFAELEAYAAQGYQDAQKWLILHEEDFQKLKVHADLGDLSAQFCINKALYFGFLDQDARPPEERIEEVIANIKRDLDASIVAGKEKTIDDCDFEDMFPLIWENFIFPVLHSLREGK
jgi:TPR repeat protein